MLISKEVVQLHLPPPKTPRSKGLHISNVIRCMATEMGILKPEWAEELSLTDVRTITDPVAILRINIGLAWEEHYIPMLGDVVDHPDEVCFEGVYMSPDGESLSVIITTPSPRYELVVHEVKATYKSTRTIAKIEDQWMWMAQIKSYCKAKGTRYAKLHVLCLCGDYKMPIRPALEIYNLEFTQDEIDDNWFLLMDYKEHRLAIEGARVEAEQELAQATDWEELKGINGPTN